MEDLVHWLIRVESLAEQFYRDSAERVKEYGKLHEFLLHLAEEEEEHRVLLQCAFELITGHIPPYRAEIAADERFRARIEDFFDQKLISIHDGTLTKSKVLRTILESEFSEWNDLFVYVMNRLKEKSKEFQHAASEMEKHRRSCIAFIEPYPEYAELAARLKEMPELWKNKIMVVESSEPVRALLEMVFRYDGSVHSTDDGADALFRLNTGYFDFVISDIELPGMSGVEMFRKASEQDDDLCNRILFFTSTVTREESAFLRTQRIPVMEKPGNITSLIEIVRKALSYEFARPRFASNL